MPFVYMKQVNIKQPTFGANRIQGFILAESGGWEDRLPFALTFNRGGAIEFGKALLELGSRASKLNNSYQAPPVPSAPEFNACPPPAYAPPYADPYYSFMTPHPSFGPPMPNSLYQSNYPPPYPGAIPPAYTQAWEGSATSPPAPYAPQTFPGTTPGFSGAYPPSTPYQPGSYGAPMPAPPPYPSSGGTEANYFQQSQHNVCSFAAAPQFPQPSAPPEEKKTN